MPARRGVGTGFSEAGSPGRPAPPQRDALGALASALIERARQSAERERERIRAAQAMSEARRRAAERERRRALVHWTAKRSLLLDAVGSIDRAIGSEGMTLSISDASVHPVYCAGVEIRVGISGRPAPPILEIVLDGDLRLLAKVLYSDLKAPAIRLPIVSKVAAHHFGDAILAYIECALSQAEVTPVRICERCGCCLPA